MTQKKTYKIEVCKGPICSGKGSQLLRSAFVDQVQTHQLSKKVRVDGGGCWGMCKQSPNVCVISKNGPTFYHQVTLPQVPLIFKYHVLK